MQSVGEVMAIGRTFAESLQKAVRSLEQGRMGFALGRDPGVRRARRRRALAPLRRRRPPSGSSRCTRCCWRGATSTRWPRAPGSTPGSSQQLAEIVEAERELADGVGARRALDRARLAALSSRLGLLRPPDRRPDGTERTRWPRRAALLGSTRPSRRSTPARPSSRPRRRTTTAPTRTRARCALAARSRDHPRLGTEPDRPGHRVRLLLRARVAWRCASWATRR